jgi:hypothetical protein
MDPFFNELGRSALERWSAVNFNPAEFPRIARELLEEKPPCDHVEVDALLQDFLLSDAQPAQSDSSFGQPELIVFEHPRLYIQVLFWMDGTTDIHQHMFSGAFHVLQGSSLHSEFAFDERRVVSSNLHVGRLRLLNAELLETGQTREIVSGTGFLHSLFHLDTPSVTVVLRTQTDPGSSPQFTYLPPFVAVDPLLSDPLTVRRKQLLDLLEQVGEPSYAQIVLEMLDQLDFERGFFILQNCVGALRADGAWEQALAVFCGKHGELAEGIEATIEEIVRRDRLVGYRGSVDDPEHRFFLALLLNVPSAEGVLRMVASRVDAHPGETILRWLRELSETSEEGVVVLDVILPLQPGATLEKTLVVFLDGMARLLGVEPGRNAGDNAGADLDRLRADLAHSSLAVLAR